MNGHADSLIHLDHVSKSFGRREVLEDVSFEVSAGEAFCMLGKSGTGKSVTLKLMIGLLASDRGSIVIDGQEVQHLDRKSLLEVRKKVGFMFQDGALFDSIPLGENLAFPLRRHTSKSVKEIREIVREKLSEVGLEKELNKMPADLSGGMRKRAGLARALVLDPPILLADEPGSGLDPVTAAEIGGLLRDLKEKQRTTLVVVTHDAAQVHGFADRLGVLDRGRMIACGTPEELADSRDELVRALASGGEAKDVFSKS
uniref:ABC-type transport system protein n=1 Tax=uncultured bacterium CSLG7 TaxID=1091577 RepID=G4WV37_9BACT|nr:ABC-type transport system protein [uncultured bacterium CSLG7]